VTEYRQERPSWCPHPTCIFKRRAMDSMCGGEIGGEVRETDEFDQLHINDLRLCLNETHQPPPTAKIVDFKVNASDLDWFRFVMDALDGKRTSWLSRRGERTRVQAAVERLENVQEDAQELHRKLAGTPHEPLAHGMEIEIGNVLNSLTETKRYEKPATPSDPMPGPETSPK
jgi:hypothetical protein